MSSKACDKVLTMNQDIDQRKIPLRDRNQSHSMLPSFAHKLALQKALCDSVSDVDKRIRIMKSFKRILGTDTKTASYVRNKSTVKAIDPSKLANQRRLTNTPSITV